MLPILVASVCLYFVSWPTPTLKAPSARTLLTLSTLPHTTPLALAPLLTQLKFHSPLL